MTIATKRDSPLTPDALSAVGVILADHLPVDPSATFEVDLLAGGRSNLSYRLRQPGIDLVLRRPPYGDILPSAHDMAREFRVLRGLHSVGYPVARPIVHRDDADLIGAPFLVMDFVDGLVVADAEKGAALGPQRADAASGAVVAALAKLHAIDPAAAGLDRLGRPQGYLQRQVARWRDQWSRTKTRELPALDALFDWLAPRVQAIPDDVPTGIVHGDFRLDNLILDDDCSVRAVLDWEMSTLGDPIADLAIALVYWNEAGDGLRPALDVARGVTESPGFATRADLVERYCGLTGAAADHLDVCVVLACAKLAVIMESIHRRAMDGLQLGTAASGLADGATTLTAMGHNVVSSGIEGLGH